MRRLAAPGLLLAAAVLGLGACASRPAQRYLPPGHVEPAAESAPPSDANFILTVSEAVGSPAEDTGSYTRVYVDGQPQGQTPVGPRSQDRSWGARLAPGNHLFRFEQWQLPAVGDWALLDAQWQPPERFIRIEPKSRAAAALKFSEGGRRHLLKVGREPL